MKKIEDYVLSIPDFPEPGIIFRDITSVLQDADGLQLAIDSMQDCLKDIDVDDCRNRVQRLYLWCTDRI